MGYYFQDNAIKESCRSVCIMAIITTIVIMITTIVVMIAKVIYINNYLKAKAISQMSQKISLFTHEVCSRCHVNWSNSVAISWRPYFE